MLLSAMPVTEMLILYVVLVSIFISVGVLGSSLVGCTDSHFSAIWIILDTFCSDCCSGCQENRLRFSLPLFLYYSNCVQVLSVPSGAHAEIKFSACTTQSLKVVNVQENQCWLQSFTTVWKQYWNCGYRNNTETHISIPSSYSNSLACLCSDK